MAFRVPGGHVFDPDDLALLRRAFALATAATVSSRNRELAARSLLADLAGGERDVVVLADHARLRVHRRTVVRFPPRGASA